MSEGRRFLPVPEAAERLGIAPITLRKWIKAGRVPAARPGVGGSGGGRLMLVPVAWLNEIERDALDAVAAPAAADERG